MRLTLSTLLVIGAPAGVLAQAQAPHRAASRVLPAIGLPLPSITAPLAPIGLPLAPIGLPLTPFGSPTDPNSPYRTDHRPISRPGHHSTIPPKQRFRSTPSIVYVVPPYGWYGYVPAPAPPPATASYVSPEPVSVEPATGTLRLELADAGGASQVYVEGYFVGTLDDAALERSDLRILEMRGAGEDHPTIAAFPEGRYLKFVVLG